MIDFDGSIEYHEGMAATIWAPLALDSGRFSDPGCGIRAHHEGPDCGRPVMYRAEVRGLIAGSVLVVLVCADHGAAARGLPDLVSMRTA